MSQSTDVTLTNIFAKSKQHLQENTEDQLMGCSFTFTCFRFSYKANNKVSSKLQIHQIQERTEHSISSTLKKLGTVYVPSASANTNNVHLMDEWMHRQCSSSGRLQTRIIFSLCTVCLTILVESPSTVSIGSIDQGNNQAKSPFTRFLCWFSISNIS